MSVILVRIDGLRLKTINGSLGTTPAASFARMGKVRRSREEVRQRIESALGDETREPIAIHVVRVAPGVLDDDNLVASWKSALDGCALAFSLDDRRFEIVTKKDQGIPVTFAQRKEGRGVYAAEFHLTFAVPVEAAS